MAEGSDHPMTYQLRMKYCYRASCKACRSGSPSHGPYWYASWREGGRVRSRYLGKHAPPGYPRDDEPRPSSAPAPQRRRRQPALRVETLGHLAVWRGKDPIDERCWNRRKATALFGILLSHPEHSVHREQLFELLWPDVDVRVAEGRLWSTIRQLRVILDVPALQGSHVTWTGDHLLLVPADHAGREGTWLDATVFERLAARALDRRDVHLCRQAIDRYGQGGDYLPRFVYEDWASRQREHLRNRLISVLLHSATLLQQEGLPEEAELYLRRILVLDACDETAARALMVLLGAQGRHGDGLQVYRALESALRDLELEPEADTKRVREQLDVARHNHSAVDVLPVRPDSAAPTNLPTLLSSFVGRRAEQESICRLLETDRLVTLTGLGGVGKTRLAVAVGTALVPTFQAGVWLAEFAALPTGATAVGVLLCQTVARALGLADSADKPLLQAVTEFLRPRHLLLILDNCEHLIDGCAELAHELLASCPRLSILATSREPLNMLGEAVWVVPPLGVPDADHVTLKQMMHAEAAQLFLARAQARHPTFTLTEANARAIAHICQKLEGIPLSLELAAARLAMLSVDQIAARLDDRFRLLTGGSRTALPRHQTLRATLHWSYALLDEPERVLLRRLSVFAGSCDLEAIEEVCTQVCSGDEIASKSAMDIVRSLASKSLVLVATQGEHARYRLLDTVRHYGREHLAAAGEEDTIRERHCRWYVSLGEQAKPRFRGAEQQYWLNRLEVDIDNIRAALEWSVSHQGAGDYGVRLASAIWQFWYMRNYVTEGRSWLERVVTATTGGAPSIWAEAFNGAGGLAMTQSDYPRAAQLLEESLRFARSAGDTWAEACALMNLGNVDGELGHYEQSLSRHKESLPIFRARPDIPNTASALCNIGITLMRLERYDEALPFLEESRDLYGSVGYKLGLAIVLPSVATVRRYRGDLDQAEIAIKESLQHLLEIDTYMYKHPVLHEIGEIEEARGRYPEALKHYREALELAIETQDEPWIREGIERIAWVSVVADAAGGPQQPPSARQSEPMSPVSGAAREDLGYAVQLFAAANEHCKLPRTPQQRTRHDGCMWSLQEALGEDAFAQCWAAGRRLTHVAAVRLALDGPQGIVRALSAGTNA